jgi:hypothetical protein
LLPAQTIKDSCAVLIPSASHGSAVLPQCMFCINRLRASCWFDWKQPLC